MTSTRLHYLGCDRSDYHLDFTLLSPGAPARTWRVSAQPAALLGWIRTWRQRHPHDQLALGFEQPASNLIALFAPFDFVVLYPLNPATLAHYRTAFVTSGAKDDPDDSRWIADLLRTHRDKLSAWDPQSVTMRQLQALVQRFSLHLLFISCWRSPCANCRPWCNSAATR